MGAAANLPRIFIFDIDGVLLESFADAIYADAMRIWFDLDDMELDWDRYPVINDIAIAEALFHQRFDRTGAREEIAAALDHYADHLQNLLKNGGFRDRAVIGAAELLTRLSQVPGNILALASAGLERAKRLRLRHRGLEDAFHVGAFAEHGRDKTEILAASIAACRQIAKFEVARSEIVYFGDRPSDVAAAASAGVRFIAVATTATTHERLLAAGAETVLADLSEAGAVIGLAN